MQTSENKINENIKYNLSPLSTKENSKYLFQSEIFKTLSFFNNIKDKNNLVNFYDSSTCRTVSKKPKSSKNKNSSYANHTNNSDKSNIIKYNFKYSQINNIIKESLHKKYSNLNIDTCLTYKNNKEENKKQNLLNNNNINHKKFNNLNININNNTNNYYYNYSNNLFNVKAKGRNISETQRIKTQNSNHNYKKQNINIYSPKSQNKNLFNQKCKNKINNSLIKQSKNHIINLNSHINTKYNMNNKNNLYSSIHKNKKIKNKANNHNIYIFTSDLAYSNKFKLYKQYHTISHNSSKNLKLNKNNYFDKNEVKKKMNKSNSSFFKCLTLNNNEDFKINVKKNEIKNEKYIYNNYNTYQNQNSKYIYNTNNYLNKDKYKNIFILNDINNNKKNNNNKKIKDKISKNDCKKEKNCNNNIFSHVDYNTKYKNQLTEIKEKTEGLLENYSKLLFLFSEKINKK